MGWGQPSSLQGRNGLSQIAQGSSLGQFFLHHQKEEADNGEAEVPQESVNCSVCRVEKATASGAEQAPFLFN